MSLVLVAGHTTHYRVGKINPVLREAASAIGGVTQRRKNLPTIPEGSVQLYMWTRVVAFNYNIYN